MNKFPAQTAKVTDVSIARTWKKVTGQDSNGKNMYEEVLDVNGNPLVRHTIELSDGSTISRSPLQLRQDLEKSKLINEGETVPKSLLILLTNSTVNFKGSYHKQGDKYIPSEKSTAEVDKDGFATARTNGWYVEEFINFRLTTEATIESIKIETEQKVQEITIANAKELSNSHIAVLDAMPA